MAKRIQFGTCRQIIIFVVLPIAIFCLFNIADYYFSISNTQSIIAQNGRTVDISSVERRKSIINEPCYPSNQNISLLPSYDDPQTKIIRTTILQHISPPLLISFGGSGNTFTRLLIEYITKIYTGSIYNGEFIKQGFVGSQYCITETIVVKFHGEHMSDVTPIIQGKWLCGTSGNIIEKFEAINGKIRNPAAIFIIRNPWDAFFALYQYWFGKKVGGRRHKSHINLDKFNVRDFRQKVSNYADKWNKNMIILQKFKDANTSHLIVKFENLVHKDYNIKIKEALKIIRFLYRDKYYKEHQDLFKHRLDCLWNISMTDERMDSIHRDKPNDKQLNKTFAYKSLKVKHICKVWNKLERFAKPFGYNIYNNVPCS